MVEYNRTGMICLVCYLEAAPLDLMHVTIDIRTNWLSLQTLQTFMEEVQLEQKLQSLLEF